ncbi:hypothetical protein HHX47_DHR9000462 [Lentinula edodes]|nr:hypothetical protein HHX47_DHR9000462 [Lentinula edodes]
MSDTEPENQHNSDPETHMADDIVSMPLRSKSERVAKNLNKSGIDGGQSSLQIEDVSNFSALDIHDQCTHMEKLIPANWIPPEDSETDQEDRDGADDIPFPLEDKNLFDDDLEEDNFWDFRKFDWEQYREYRNDSWLPALQQVHAGYFSEFSEIIIPRLKAFAMNPEVAKNMQYLNNFTNGSSEVRTTKDVFDGEDYKFLRKQNVVVGSRTYTYHHFNDHQDIALGLSTDGFGPFKRRKHTCWPLILFNYNLPPEIQFHMENILAVGVIPGPKKPKDADSFMWPLVREMLQLALGITTFDVLLKKIFTLRAYLILVFGDIPAVTMIM